LSYYPENNEILRNKGKLFVVKLGGSAMTDNGLNKSFALDISALRSSGIKIAIVHGGGKEITDLSNKLKVPVKFVNGLRVTDKSTMEIALMILAGKINKEIVSGLNKFKVNAVGISGIDGNLFKVEKLISGKHDLGYVGKILEINSDFINLLLPNDYIPVIAPIGFNDEGEMFNINADDAASALACALKAEKLIYLSDVGGVMHNGKIVKTIDYDIARQMIERNYITNGMIPKVMSAFKSINSGVKRVHIIDGRIENSVINGVFSNKKTGTEIIGTKKDFLNQTL
jgi:acetylglutamate kinase